jgi:hypothetical protein
MEDRWRRGASGRDVLDKSNRQLPFTECPCNNFIQLLQRGLIHSPLGYGRSAIRDIYETLGYLVPVGCYTASIPIVAAVGLECCAVVGAMKYTSVYFQCRIRRLGLGLLPGSGSFFFYLFCSISQDRNYNCLVDSTYLHDLDLFAWWYWFICYEFYVSQE